MNWLYINYQLFMHWLLFIHKILISSTCFEPQVLIFSRIQLYTCSVWYCHSLWEFLVACRYTAWVRPDCRGKVVGRASGFGERQRGCIMLVYYFVPFIVNNRYLLFWVSSGHNSVTVQNRTHVCMKFFDHKDLGNHLLQLRPQVVKHPVYYIKEDLCREREF